MDMAQTTVTMDSLFARSPLPDLMVCTSPSSGGYTATASKHNSPIHNVFTCGICLQLCAYPTLFGCNEHYYCAFCIRTWIASQCCLDDTNRYVFDVSCPACRRVVKHCDNRLQTVPASIHEMIHTALPDKRKGQCPFCTLRNPSKEHVSICAQWRVKCRRHGCGRLVAFIDLGRHNLECGWRCQSLGCEDGHGLTLDEQITHSQEHGDLTRALTRLTRTTQHMCADRFERTETTRIYNEAAAALERLYEPLVEEGEVSDAEEVDNDNNSSDEDNVMGSDFVTASMLRHHTVHGVQLSSLVSYMKLQMEIEYQMLTGFDALSFNERQRLCDKWRQLDDYVPKIPLSIWVTDHLSQWALLPPEIRLRIITLPYTPPSASTPPPVG